MVKAGFLLPHEDMIEDAKWIAAEEGLEIAYVGRTHSYDAVSQAERAVDAGADILIARGHQAMLIRQHMDTPMVEMKLVTQELGLLLQKAKSISRKRKPHILLAAFENMLGDMSKLEELFSVKLSVMFLNDIREVDEVVKRFGELKCDVLIAGETICRNALKAGIPSVYYSSTSESIRGAVRSAVRMAYAIKKEREDAVQLKDLMDASFSAIIQIDKDGKITALNKNAERLADAEDGDDTVGRPVAETFPYIPMSMLRDVLEGSTESCMTTVEVDERSYMVSMTPIIYGEAPDGAVISISRLSQSRRGVKEEPYANRLSYRFEDISAESRTMKSCLERARTFAVSDSPILIKAGPGLEDIELASAIHNNSRRRSGPFFFVDMGTIDAWGQGRIIFGAHGKDDGSGESYLGIAVRFKRGTIYIRNVERMDLMLQRRLAALISRRHPAMEELDISYGSDMRIIASTSREPALLVSSGAMDVELCHMLRGLDLEIPGLSKRQEDLRNYIEKYLKRFQMEYNRHFRITDGGYEKLCSFDWNGNIIQVRGFCENLVLTLKKHAADEGTIQRIYEELYPDTGSGPDGKERLVVYRDPESRRIAEVLSRYHGNRQLAARELGMSQTTLWRRIKKFGIAADHLMDE